MHCNAINFIYTYQKSKWKEIYHACWWRVRCRKRLCLCEIKTELQTLYCACACVCVRVEKLLNTHFSGLNAENYRFTSTINIIMCAWVEKCRENEHGERKTGKKCTNKREFKNDFDITNHLMLTFGFSCWHDCWRWIKYSVNHNISSRYLSKYISRKNFALICFSQKKITWNKNLTIHVS